MTVFCLFLVSHRACLLPVFICVSWTVLRHRRFRSVHHITYRVRESNICFNFVAADTSPPLPPPAPLRNSFSFLEISSPMING